MTVTVSEGLQLCGGPGTRPDPVLWLRRYHPVDAAAPRLVCCPHSGGSAGYFLPLSAALAPAVAVQAVQYPGRQDRRAEPLVADLRDLASRLAAVLADEPGPPPALFGHSMGAMLAFEVARQLERDGRYVSALFVSGHRPPSARAAAPLHGVSDRELLHAVRGLGGTEAELLEDEEIAELVLPVIRNDTRAVETYHLEAGGEPELGCPIIALSGTADPQVTVAEADAWRRHTSGKFDLHTFPGGHFYLNAHTAELRSLIGARLTGNSDG